MNCFKSSKFLLTLILIIPFSTSLAQDEEEESQDGGSAAEAAVTGSASQPTTGASGAIESNPLVFAVRSGVDLQQALSLGLTAIREMAASGSDNFVSQVNSVAKINSEGGSIDFSLIEALSDLDLSDDVYKATMTVGSLYTTTSASLSTTYQEALVQAATLANTLLVDRTITSVSDIPTTIGVSDLASSGYNVALLELLNSYGAIGSNGSTLLDSVMSTSRSLDGTLSSLSSTSDYLSYLSTLTGSRTFSELDAESTVLSVPMSNVNLAPGANITLGTATISASEANPYANGYAPDSLDGLTVKVDNSADYVISDNTILLASSASILGDKFTLNGTTLTNDTDGITDTTTVSWIKTDSNTVTISVPDQTNTFEALGVSTNLTLKDQTVDVIFTGPNEGTFSYKTKVYSSSTGNDLADSYISDLLSSETYDGIFTETGSWSFSDDTKRPVYTESDSTQAGSSISVESLLGKATSTNDRKIAIIGAAKDMTVKGDVTFTNPNDAEDHALVLGSADDFMVDGKDITYTGSNLALGAGGTDADSMYLVNTTITTGGNLAAGTLGTLNISNADFVVGNANSATSDPDNVYLYANDLIQVNGLNFSGSRLDDVYMEAITINLNDVDFPSTAEVMLRSKDGSLHFGTYSKPVVGGVNLTDVTHGAINGGQTLQASDFDGTTGGHIDSIQALGNGIPAISVRAQ
ncbi:MAG: hypothetical protein ACJZ7A_03320 [Opitutales bacterium]